MVGVQVGSTVCVQPLVGSQASVVHSSLSSQLPHVVQLAAPESAKVPAVQGVHVSEPLAPACVPAGQAVHPVLPEPVAK